jgi:hypothetical protein
VVGFATRQDLMEAVFGYDPITQFLIFDGLANDIGTQFTEVRILVWTYRFLPPLTSIT